MIARIPAVIALVAVALQPSMAAGLSSATQFGPPTIRLEPGDTYHATRSALVPLQRGETGVTLPLSDLGISASDAILEVQPDDCVRVVAMRTGAGGANWLLHASRDVEAALTLTYPVTGLSRAIEYTAALGADGSLALDASLRITNGLDRDLSNARLVGDFTRAELSLQAGQAVTVEQPWLSARIAPEHVTGSFVYDKALHGDAPIKLLTISPHAPARATALPAGSARIYASADAGGDFIRSTALPYCPPREPIELSLGDASGIVVKRTLDSAREVDKRLDARNKVALFDLQETWILEVRNLRQEPVDLAIREHHDGVWKLEQCDTDYERIDAETLAFAVTIQPGERREITFRIRHQNRQP